LIDPNSAIENYQVEFKNTEGNIINSPMTNHEVDTNNVDQNSTKYSIINLRELLEGPLTFEYNNDADGFLMDNIFITVPSISAPIEVNDKNLAPENDPDIISNQSFSISGINEIQKILIITNTFAILDNNPAAIAVNNDTPLKKSMKRRREA